jgi:hypothetical protein
MANVKIKPIGDVASKKKKVRGGKAKEKPQEAKSSPSAPARRTTTATSDPSK